jgi:hypothetical protein
MSDRSDQTSPSGQRTEAAARSAHVVERPAPVRPRLVWAGTATALAGMVAVAIGMMLANHWLWLSGIGLIVVGLGVGWRAGMLFDTHAQPPTHEAVEGIEQGGTRMGVTPTSRIEGVRANEIAVRVTRQRRELTDRVVAMPFPSVGPIGVTVLLALAVWMLVGQWVLVYPLSSNGQNVELRELGFCVVIALAALRLRQLGPSRTASGLCLLSGISLVALGLTLDLTVTRVGINEVVVGTLTILAAAMTLSSKDQLTPE